jgi:hypothetical protein
VTRYGHAPCQDEADQQPGGQAERDRQRWENEEGGEGEQGQPAPLAEQSPSDDHLVSPTHEYRDEPRDREVGQDQGDPGEGAPTYGQDQPRPDQGVGQKRTGQRGEQPEIRFSAAIREVKGPEGHGPPSTAGGACGQMVDHLMRAQAEKREGGECAEVLREQRKNDLLLLYE